MGCSTHKSDKPAQKKLSLKSHEAQPIKKFKVVLLGSASVGKTSIATQYCLGQRSKDYGPTVGGVYFKKETKTKSGGEITINIWDTAGQQKYRSMASLYYRDADIIMLVFDLADETSFKELEYWIGELDYRIQKNDVAIIIIGNKADLPKRAIQKNRFQGWIRNYPGFLGFQASAKTGKGVEEIFQAAIQSYINKQKKS